MGVNPSVARGVDVRAGRGEEALGLGFAPIMPM